MPFRHLLASLQVELASKEIELESREVDLASGQVDLTWHQVELRLYEVGLCQGGAAALSDVVALCSACSTGRRGSVVGFSGSRA